MQSRLSSMERRTQILDAARSLFASKGYAEATLDDIARKVGITRPRIIQLFGTKQRIYETIAATAYRDHPLDKDLAGPMEQKDDLAVFEAFAAHILHHSRKRKERDLLKILLNARLKEDRFHRVHFQKQDMLMMSRLESYVKERMECGAFRRMDPRTVIFAYQAMVFNLALYKNVMKRMDFVTIEELSRDCARIFVDGIGDRSGETLNLKKKGKV